MSDGSKLSLKEKMRQRQRQSNNVEAFIPGGGMGFQPQPGMMGMMNGGFGGHMTPQQLQQMQQMMFMQQQGMYGMPQQGMYGMQGGFPQQGMYGMQGGFPQQGMHGGYQPHQQQAQQGYQAEEPEQAPEPEPAQEEYIDVDQYFKEVQDGNIQNNSNAPTVKTDNRRGKKGKKQAAKKEKKEKKVKIEKEEEVDTDKLKSKEANKDKLFDDKENKNIIVIGHVDSGKSTICGNMLVRSGKVDDAELRRYEQEAAENGRESWIWAYVMDINEEERAKGKTVDVGKAMFDLPNTRYTILDCPGHKNYVPNMISGVAQADVAALVVSAKGGEFEAGFEKAGQTREHTILASNMGDSSLVIIVNKMDECEWGLERFNYIKDSLTPFLEKTCNIDVANKVYWVPVDGFNGVNVDTRVTKEQCPWYDGPSLFETLDKLPKLNRIERNCLRIPVLDANKDAGNICVFGKVESGKVREGMKVVMMPSKKGFTVTKIFDNEDREVVLAESGENIKMHVKGIELGSISRGMMVCGKQFQCHVAQVFEAQLKVMHPPENKVISNGFSGIIHLHTIQEEFTIKKVKTNDTENKKGGLIVLKPEQEGIVVIEAKLPLCVEKFSEFPEISRFSLRADSSTIAVGKVLRVKPIAKEHEHTDYYKFLESQKAAN